MKFISLIIIFCLSIFLNALKFYQPKAVIDSFNNNMAEESELKFIIESLSKTFNDTYAFNEISKNPPNNYNKVDIQNTLNEINTKNRSKYNFYQDLKKALFQLEDSHIDFNFSNYLPFMNNLFFVQPLRLDIKIVNNKPRFFGRPYLNDQANSNFRNSDKIFTVINNNVNTPIYTINGKDPFTYITDFGKDYFRLKSPYATFVSHFNTFNHDINFYYLPLSVEELTDYTVVYDNDNKDSFTTDFLILDISNSNRLLVENESKEDEVLLKKNNLNKNLFSIYNKGNLLSNGIVWNINFNNIFKCRVDDSQKVNVYYINSFGNQNILNEYISNIIECAKLFDNNDYPIIVINSLNGGGQGYLSQVLLELLSPTVSFNIYMAMRKKEYVKNTPEFNQHISNYVNSENCQTLTYEYLTKKSHNINYGNNISDTLTEPFILSPKNLKDIINNVKKNFKNPRKPTDILVFTDGYSYSSAAIFLKYLQYYGGGITAGYFYNPNLNDPFDSGLSASIVYNYVSLQLLSPEGYKPLYDKYKFTLAIPGLQTFYNPNNLSNPLEYEITPVDEKVGIYESFSDNNYLNFIKESLPILNKYKNSCNPNNTKLVLITSECDKSFENTYTHGGYQCGKDGKWSNNCVASYCDIGYTFDHEKHQCVIDVCSDRDEDNKNESDRDEDNKNESNYLVYYIIGGVIILLIISSIIIFICVRKYKLKKANSTDIEINENTKILV